ncbi:MAG: ASKHA domain-containing protein [bacterium]
MREREFIVRFRPEGTHVHVLPGTTILEAASRANIIIETPCGGKGTCGQCRVIVEGNAPDPGPAERQLLSDEELAAGVRLACQAEVRSDLTVEVPAASRFIGQKILAHGIGAACELEPCVRLAPDDRAGLLYGAAFDLGTTTVVGALLDLTTGRRLAVASRPNPQIPLGDDVIARIGHAGTDGGLEELRSLLMDAVNEMLGEMCEEAGASVESVYEVAFGGNTTMNHILLGVDPTPLGHAPYEAVVVESRAAPAAELGLRIRPAGRAYTMPNIAGYVGGDTVGVILASAMDEYDGVQLALDIGTNGEIVLGGAGRLVACSTAAGPAFEGARLRHGMRAAPGAIEKVTIDHDVRVGVIEDTRPRGICGSGVLDAIAALLEAGVLESTGRLLSPDELPAGTPDELNRRLVELDGQPAFILAEAEDSATGRPVCLTQRDIREVQLGKGAISAGTRIIVREYGIEPEEIERVLLAGAFGNFARPRSVIRLGLLPGVPEGKVEFIGNAAGTGVQMVLAGRSCRESVDRIARTTEYIELAGRPDFQMEFAEAMMFPDG